MSSQKFSYYTLQSIPQLVFWIDLAGRVHFLNRALEERLDYAGDDTDDLTVDRLFPELGADRYRGLYERLRDGGEELLTLALRPRKGRRFSATFTVRYRNLPEGPFLFGVGQETPPPPNVPLVTEAPKAFVGKSPELTRVLAQARAAAASGLTVLIQGETGTGKELLAELIHQHSPRASAPLTVVNCATLSGQTLASELFGHVVGAYTGAAGARRGLLRGADGATLFLDEIGELPSDAQAMLLRAIEYGTVKPLGGDDEDTVRVDVRLIAATNRDLRAMVTAGTFREDLLNRIERLALRLPPLRDRREDIPALVRHFLDQLNARLGRALTLPARVELERFAAYSFPGNIRELAALVERGYVLLSPGAELALPVVSPAGTAPAPAGFVSFQEAQRQYLIRALRHCRGRVSGPRGAAVLLDMNPHTLSSKLQSLGIDPRELH